MITGYLKLIFVYLKARNALCIITLTSMFLINIKNTASSGGNMVFLGTN